MLSKILLHLMASGLIGTAKAIPTGADLDLESIERDLTKFGVRHEETTDDEMYYDDNNWPTLDEAFAHDPHGLFYDYTTYDGCVADHNATFCDELAGAYGNVDTFDHLGKRDGKSWSHDNEFMFYQQNEYKACKTTRGSCGHLDTWEKRIILRDSCNSDVCNDNINIDGWGIDDWTSLCERDFSACRVSGKRWDLSMRKVDRPGTCAKLTRIIPEGGDRRWPWNKMRYSTLHSGQDGRRVGHCWIYSEHSFTRTCFFLDAAIIYSSLVRCTFTGR